MNASHRVITPSDLKIVVCEKDDGGSYHHCVTGPLQVGVGDEIRLEFDSPPGIGLTGLTPEVVEGESVAVQGVHRVEPISKGPQPRGIDRLQAVFSAKKPGRSEIRVTPIDSKGREQNIVALSVEVV